MSHEQTESNSNQERSNLISAVIMMRAWDWIEVIREWPVIDVVPVATIRIPAPEARSTVYSALNKIVKESKNGKVN